MITDQINIFRPQIYLPQSVVPLVQSAHPLDFDFIYRNLQISDEMLDSFNKMNISLEVDWIKCEFYQVLKNHAIRSPYLNLKKSNGYNYLDLYGVSPKNQEKVFSQYFSTRERCKKQSKPFPLVTPFYHYSNTKLILKDDGDYSCVLANTKFEKHIFKVFSSSNSRSLPILLKAFNEKFFLLPSVDYILLLSWKIDLKNGFNLMLSGRGSKFFHLNEFYALCDDGIRCLINGYRLIKEFPKQLIVRILKKYFKSNVKPKDDVFDMLLKKLDSLRLPLYIIVHGLDYMIINKLKYIDDFLKLLTHRNVRCIFSFDRVWGELCLTSHEYIKYNIKQIVIETGLDYRYEVESMWFTSHPDFFFKGLKSPNFEGYQSVLSALTKNHKKLLIILAELQLEYTTGVPRSLLLREANTICNSEEKLDNLLLEFLSHKLIKENKTKGKISYIIPLDTNSIISLTESDK